MNELTTGEAARAVGAETWQVQRLFERGLLPEPARLGRYRIFRESDLPTIEAALRDHGYLGAKEVAPI